MPTWSPPCPFLALTGIDCPGCGGTRATLALLDGDLHRAVDHNLLVLLLGVGLLVLAVRWAILRRSDAQEQRAAFPNWWTIGASVVGLTFWVLRVAGPESVRWLDSGVSW